MLACYINYILTGACRFMLLGWCCVNTMGGC